MNLSRSLEKRKKRNCEKINSKYIKGLGLGYSPSYKFQPCFYNLYFQRLLLVIASALTFRKSTFNTFTGILGKNFFPFALDQSNTSENNRFKEFLRVLMGYRFQDLPDLYPALPSPVILTKTLSLPSYSNPLVSIIIVVNNPLSYTYNCLLSIKNNVSADIGFEVIVVDIASTDATRKFLKERVSDVKYIRYEDRTLPADAYNDAIRLATGKYICLLNGKTQVKKGWLEALLDVIEKDPTVGCVGSKTVFPNGLLEQAGGIIFQDGQLSYYGYMDSQQKEKYSYIREADFCSLSSTLFLKKDFDDLKGFDNKLDSDYFLAADFCMSLQDILSKKVIYQPLSELIHFEVPGELGADFKSELFFSQREKFVSKWSSGLSKYCAAGNNESGARRLQKTSILIIERYLPTYDKDSGSLRIFRIMKILRSLNYHVIYLPHYPEIKEPYFTSLIKEGFEINSTCFDDPEALAKVKFGWGAIPEVNSIYKERISSLKSVKWFYDTVDLHHLRMQREAELSSDERLSLEAEKMKDLELELAQQATVTLTVTEKEASLLHEYGISNTAVIPNIHISFETEKLKAVDERTGLLFIGGYQHVPNVDAALWLINGIMPIVWETRPDIKVFLLGSYPPQSVLDLASEKVSVPGFLEDVSDYFLSSKLFVSPLRYGAGMKGKIGQSLEYSLPVVSTSIGIEGMGLQDGINVLVADDEIGFASKILELYEDDTLWYRISEGSRSAIEKYSPESVSVQLQSLLAS